MNAVNLLCRVYRLFLRVYPEPFRQEYGPEMVLFFRDRCRTALRNGDLLPFLTHASLDLVRTAAEEHAALLAFGWRPSAPKLLNGMIVSSILFYSFGAMVGMERPRQYEQDERPLQRAERIANRTAQDILNQFFWADIVVLGEWHDSQADAERRDRIVRLPAFRRNVHNIVVEWANSLYQDDIDRYVSGGDVADEVIAQAWRQTTQGRNRECQACASFLRQMRLLNMRSAADEQVRVVAGDAPIDWRRVRTPEDQKRFLRQRDTFAAALISHEIAAKGEKALVIYGAGHVWRGATLLREANLVTLLDQQLPGRIFTVLGLKGQASTSGLVRLKSNVAGDADANEAIGGGGASLHLFPAGFPLRQAADAVVYNGGS